jgi:hypothetical protein
VYKNDVSCLFLADRFNDCLFEKKKTFLKGKKGKKRSNDGCAGSEKGNYTLLTSGPFYTGS